MVVRRPRRFYRRVKRPGEDGTIHAATIQVFLHTACGVSLADVTGWVQLGDSRLVTCIGCIAEGSDGS